MFEIQRVASIIGSDKLTRAAFDQHALCNSAALEDRFGSWSQALARADFAVVPRGRRHSDEDYFENLLTVWTHFGRQPFYREMDSPPSRITAGAYEKKFGTWRQALAAFISQVNGPRAPAKVKLEEQSSAHQMVVQRRPQKLSLGIRYEILRRDRFRCVLCGRSPATHPQLTLHVDHIDHRSRGGSNDPSNLRTLCNECNIGRGTKQDDPDHDLVI